jgi:hypothetical protein
MPQLRGPRRARSLQEMTEDPQFVLMIGRLVGASEMTSWWLTLRDDAESKEVGRRLGEVVDWFFEGDRREMTRPSTDSAE